jgi:hypothetical protein
MKTTTIGQINSKITMKKFFLIPIICLLFLNSCGPSQEELDKLMQTQDLNDFKQSDEYKEFEKNKKQDLEQNSLVVKKVITNPSTVLTQYEIDDCYYIGNIGFTTYSSNTYYLTHKGNCKFCHIRDSILIRSIVKDIVNNPYEIQIH